MRRRWGTFLHWMECGFWIELVDAASLSPFNRDPVQIFPLFFFHSCTDAATMLGSLLLKYIPLVVDFSGFPSSALPQIAHEH